MWIYGIPGCGKTILCSTIIKTLQAQCSGTDSRCAYFYIDFSQAADQNIRNILGCFLVQLVAGVPSRSRLIHQLYKECEQGLRQPTVAALTAILKKVLQNIPDAFLIIDALDEHGDREELLGLLKAILDWELLNMHLLVTSRRETDIVEAIGELVTDEIGLHDAVVNADINLYVQCQVAADRRLRKWPEIVKEEIIAALMDGAHGM